MTPITTIDDPRYVKAMSHPVRARIMAMLAERQASPNELAQWLETTLGGTAYHVRTLFKLGLIELVNETRVRGAVEHHYRARALPQRTARSTPRATQADAAAALEMVGDHLRPAVAMGGFDGADAVLRRLTLTLDDRGVAALAVEARKLVERAERIEQAAAKRLAKTANADAPNTAGLAVFVFQTRPLADQIPPRERKRGPALVGSPRVSAENRVLEVLRSGPPATLAELSEATGLGQPTVRRVTKTLIDKRRARELDQRRRAQGVRGPGALVFEAVSPGVIR